MAIIQLRDTWDAYLHAEENAAWTFYHPDVEVLYVPTSMGAHGLDAYKQWYYKYMEPCLRQGLVEKRRILKTHFAMDSVIEEAIVDIHFQYGQENDLAWIVPGVKFLNQNFHIKVSVVFLTVHNFTQHPFQIRSKHVHWDQGSVLKQLNLLQAAVSTPPTYAFLPNFVLPLVKADPATLYQPTVLLNEFATRYEVPTPTSSPLQVTLDPLQLTDVDILSDTPPPVHPPHTHVRVNYAAAAVNKESKIFSPTTLPVHAFSGIPVHPKKFEQHASVIGDTTSIVQPISVSNPTHLTSSSSSSSSSSTTLSLSSTSSHGTSGRHLVFDPLTGETTVVKYHDPLNHTTQIVLSTCPSTSKNNESSTHGPEGGLRSSSVSPRKDMVSSMDQPHLTALLPSDQRGVLSNPEKTRLKPKPSHVVSHFQTSLSTQSMEETLPGGSSSNPNEKPSLTSEKKTKPLPPHLISSITSTGVGMDSSPPHYPVRPKSIHSISFHEESLSTSSSSSTEKHPSLLSTEKGPTPTPTLPKHLLESMDPPMSNRSMRVDLQTTLDQSPAPPKTILRKGGYKKELESHLFDPPVSPVTKVMKKVPLHCQSTVFSTSSITSTSQGSLPLTSCPSTLNDPSTSNVNTTLPFNPHPPLGPKKPHSTTKVHLESIVFTEAFDQVDHLPKRPVSEQRFKDDVVFGDDGGTTGLSIESPKYVVSSGRRKQKHIPTGGLSTIQLG
ncbi:hypothetical protein HMI54_013147 [Coelomomyces lativittatus]|nr:hypothetical protein HMI55_007363 [Coelomomyces lativittatus]KAJ1510721.1 hypothetical protein HMI56_006206 [Coelomomyces lativittatus]KAJ1518650.1 hypothetical protein HMI54_013147 [Coelomomyces lativittatus]